MQKHFSIELKQIHDKSGYNLFVSNGIKEVAVRLSNEDAKDPNIMVLVTEMINKIERIS